MYTMTSSRNEARLGRFRSLPLVLASVSVAGLLSLGACNTSDLLEVESPDIIEPAGVQSAAGANAVRIGALARFTQATTGAESLVLLGGLFADEWINGDTFTDRHEVDRREVQPGNAFLTTADRNLHRGRLSAAQAVDLLEEWIPSAPGWQKAEMHFIQAYLVNLAGEVYCNGLTFSEVRNGVLEYGMPITTAAAFQRALGHADQGLASVTGSTAADTRVRNALLLTRGRILMNLDQPTQAAAAVSTVPTAYRYDMLHSATAFSNTMWNWNTLTRRYSVGNNEGVNGLNFATAGDPRVPVCTAPCPQVGVTSATREDATRPLHVQLLWGARESPVALLSGVDARMVEAEAQLRAGNAAGALAILNAARSTVPGLTPLADAGTPEARLNQLFRERAFWAFGRGHRMGDLRRLVRQYGRAESSVFPVGEWHKAGAVYSSGVNMPIPLAESNNPNVSASALCTDRNP
jgi:starch-binding outer membrane protein, SusD/RagB family